MPNIFAGLQFESPLEAQRRIRQETQKKALSLSGNSRTQVGFLLGEALGRGIDKLRGKTNPAIQDAGNTEQVIAAANQQVEEALQGGADPVQAQFDAYMKAASRFGGLGLTQQQSAAMSAAVQLKLQMEQAAAEKAKLQAEEAAAEADVTESRQKLENDLRKEVDAQLEDTVVVTDQLQAVERNAQQNTPAGDLALIFSFMKVLDPRSVVRESEFQTVADAREGLLAVAAGQSVDGLNISQEAAARAVSMLRGTRFTDITRAQIINAARAAAADRVKGSQDVITDALELASDREWDVEAVRSGLAERVQGVEINPITEEQMAAVASGVPLKDAMAGRLTPPRTQEQIDEIDAVARQILSQ